MLSSVSIKNFKAFKRSGDIPLRPLTVLIGRNNSGKSTVLETLLSLKQTLEDRSTGPAMVTSGEWIDLGSYEDVHSHLSETDEPISITLRLDESESSRLPTNAFSHLLEGDNDERVELDVSFKYSGRENRIVLSSSSVSVGGVEVAGVARAGSGYRAYNLPTEYSDHTHASRLNFIPNIILRGERPEDEELANEIMSVNYRWQFLSQKWFGLLTARLNRVSPVRQQVPRYGIRGAAPGQWVGGGGAALLRELRSQRKVSDTRTLLEFIRHWMCEEFNLLDDLQLEPVGDTDRIVQLVGGTGGSPLVNVASMGAGISQLLPIVAAVGETGPRDCLLVEQPEIHLHPAAQSNIADLFIDSVIDGNGQYIIETHSEHFVLRLRRRIAEMKLDPSNVALLFVERENGVAHVRRIEIKDNGEVVRWPEGFFAEDYHEARALSLAARRDNDK